MQMRPWFGNEERDAISNYMDENGFITEFMRTEIFEKMIADYTGARHCIVVSNGTISLTLAALAVGIKAGDEVIVPNYTMIATPNSIKLFGAEPLFVDVESETLCLDIKLVEASITLKTKAIMLVSANGRFPRSGIKSFEALAAKYDLILIEDAAQSLGSFYPDGRHIGRAAVVGSFSFSSPKIISTGQGGALITDSDEVALKLRRLKDFGRSTGGIDTHESIGYNFKFTDLQACVGIEQMKKLPERVIRKKEIWHEYRQYLSEISEIKLFDHNLEYTVPWFIDARVEDRDNLVSFLKNKGIGTRKMYPPINKQKPYQTNRICSVSEEVGKNGLWLPSYGQLTELEIKKVCDAICDFYY